MRIDSANLVATTILSGSFEVTGSPVPGSTSTYDLGAPSSFWRNVYSTKLTGSLTKLSDGTSYLVAGSGITITTGSGGSVTVTSTVAGASFVAGDDTQIQFNDTNSFGASADFTFNNTTSALVQGSSSNTASGLGSHAEGSTTSASGDYSHAEGSGTTSSGDYSHAEGANAIASGLYSHAEGLDALASGESSHAEGRITLASGTSSHAEGFVTTAEGLCSHAEGSRTTAYGESSHAEGSGSISYGAGSHASGYHVISSGSNIGQNVVGKYNLRNNNFSLFVVGNGTNDADGTRSDVLRVNSGSLGNGRVEVTGSLAATTGLSGSLTKLADGTSYLVAGSNVTITTGSSGQVTIASSSPAGTVTGTGTVNFLTKWTGTSGIGDSIISSVGSEVGVTGSFLPGTDNTYNLGSTAKRWNNIFANNISGSLTGSNVSVGQVVVASAGSVLSGSNLLYWNDSTANLLVGATTTVGDSTNRLQLSDNPTNLRSMEFRPGATNYFLNYNRATPGYLPLWLGASTFTFSDGTYTNFIDSNGNMGIGVSSATTTISSKFFISGSSTTSTPTMIVREGVVSPTGGAGVLNVQNSAGTSILFVSGSGNVGIGTTGGTIVDRLVIGSLGTSSPFGIIIGESYGAGSGKARLGLADANRGIGLSAADHTVVHTWSTNSILFGHGTPTSLTERMRIDSSGNVGIGTTTTGDRLAVNGSMSVTGSLLPGTDNLYNLGSAAKRWATIFATSVSGSFTGSNVLAGQVIVAGAGGVLSGSNSFWWDNSAGRVGIGTTSPGTRLHVSDNQASATVRFQLANTNALGGPLRLGYFPDSAGFHLTVNGNPSHTNSPSNTVTRDSSVRASFEMLNQMGSTLADSYLDFRYALTSTFSPVMRIQGDGNVGIGTTTLLARLHISGSSTASTPTMIVREGVVSPANGAAVLDVQNSAGTTILFVTGSQRVGIGTSNPNYLLDVAGTAYIRGTTIGDPGVEGAYRIKFADAGGTYNDTGIGIDSSSNLWFNTVATTGITFNLGTNLEAMRLSSVGNLLLGTTSNLARLTVSGSSTASTPTATVKAGHASPTSAILDVQDYVGTTVLAVSASQTLSANGSATAPAYSFLAGTSTGIYRRTTGQLLGFTVSGGQAMGIDTNGNVGVGVTPTSNPSARLHVNGSSTATTPTMIVQAGVASPLGGAGILDVQNSAGTSILFVSGSGRVGIGVTTPAARFVISGSSTATEAEVIIREGVPNPQSGVGIFDVQNSAGTSLLFVSGSGNVGIGTASPQEKAQVYGNLKVGVLANGSYISLADESTAGRYVGIFRGAGDTALSVGGYSAISFTVGAAALGSQTERVRIDSSGNVGIGTSTTGDKLAVNGSMSVTGSLLPGTDNLYNLGSAAKRWATIFASSLTGSLTKLVDGTSAFIAGTNVTIITGSNGAVSISASGGGDSAAPYLVLSATGSLSNERVFTAGTGISVTDAGAGGNYTVGINNSVVATVSGTRFTGDVRTATDFIAEGYLRSLNSSGDEGGEIFLTGSVTNTTLSNGVTIDVYQNKLRFFEQGGSARGFYIDISTGGVAASTNLVVSGTGDINSVSAGTGLTGGGTSGDVTLAINDSVVATLSGSTFTGLVKVNGGISGSLTSSNVTAGQVVVAGTAGVLSGTNNFVWNNSSGYVGVGTSSPNAIISVYHASLPTLSLWNSSNYSRFATNVNDFYLDVGLGGATGATVFRRGSGTAESARIDSNGNVGIGTSVMADKLAVNGSTSITGSLLPGQHLTHDIGSSTKYWRDVYARSGSFTGDVSITGNLTVAGTQTIINTDVLNIKDNAILVNAGPSPQSTGGIYVADTTANTTGSLVWDTTTDQWKAGRLGSETTLVSGSGTTNYLAKWSGSNAIGTSVVYDDGTNIGIGTASDGTKLYVRYDNASSYTSSGFNTSTLHLRNVTGASDGLTMMTFSSAWSGGGWYLGLVDAGVSYASNFVFQTRTGASTTAERMRIDSSGNVGINTTSMTLRLEVSGSDAKIHDVRVGRGPGATISNTLVGGNAGGSLGSGAIYATIVGAYAGNYISTGNYNTLVGTQAGNNITTSNNNTYLGANAGYRQSGGENTSVGRDALIGGIGASASGNTAIGVYAGLSVTTGGNNFFGGHQAGFSNSTASGGVVLGYQAGYYNASGSYNVSIGYQAGLGVSAATTTGTENVSVGYLAGYGLTSATRNVLVGSNAGNSMSTGGGNVAVGYGAGYRVTTNTEVTAVGNLALAYSVGASNTAVGSAALKGLDGQTTGGGNTGIGANVGAVITTGTYNTIAGYNAGLYLSTGTSNSFMGFRAGQNTSVGGYNVAIGIDASVLNTSGSFNTSVGYQAGYSSTTTSNLTSIGGNANLYQKGTGLVAVGYGALQGASGQSTATSNTAIGVQAGTAVTTGGLNTFLGFQAGYTSSVATNNVLLGYQSGFSLTSGSNQVVIGYQSGYSLTTGDQNVIIGRTAGYTLTTEQYNTFVGMNAGRYTKSIQNTSLGFDALLGQSGGTSTGAYNVAVGYGAGRASQTGNGNLFVGYQAGLLATDGNYNTFIGYQAGDAVTTGANNIIIGSGADLASATDSNSIVIGSGSVGIGSNTIVLGNSSTTTTYLIGNVGIGTSVMTDKLAVNGSMSVTGSVLPGVHNTYNLGSSTKSWAAVYALTASAPLNITTAATTSATYSRIFASGESCKVTATVDIASAASKSFTVSANNGAHLFDVSVVCSEGSFSIAKKFTVATQYGAIPVTFKVIDTGPYSGYDFTVAFSKSNATTTQCTITNGFTSTVNFALTIDIAASSTGSGGTTLTIF